MFIAYCSGCKSRITRRMAYRQEGYCDACYKKVMAERRQYTIKQLKPAAVILAAKTYNQTHDINDVFDTVWCYYRNNGYKLNVLSRRLRRMVQDGIAAADAVRVAEELRK